MVNIASKTRVEAFRKERVALPPLFTGHILFLSINIFHLLILSLINILLFTWNCRKKIPFLLYPILPYVSAMPFLHQTNSRSIIH